MQGVGKDKSLLNMAAGLNNFKVERIQEHY